MIERKQLWIGQPSIQFSNEKLYKWKKTKTEGMKFQGKKKQMMTYLIG